MQSLEGRLNDQLDRAATSSFERSFLFAALLAGLALVPIALSRSACRCEAARAERSRCSAARPRVAVSVPGAYLALGGGSYSPSTVRNPCAERSWRDPGGFQAVAQQIALSALDGAACHFGVSRETLTIALATSSSRARFAREHHVDNDELENAVRRGLERSRRRRRPGRARSAAGAPTRCASPPSTCRSSRWRTSSTCCARWQAASDG